MELCTIQRSLAYYGSPSYQVGWLVIGIDVVQGRCQNTSLRGAVLLSSPSAIIYVSLLTRQRTFGFGTWFVSAQLDADLLSSQGQHCSLFCPRSKPSSICCVRLRSWLVVNLLGQNPACSGIRCSSVYGARQLMMSLSNSLCSCGRVERRVYSS